MSNPFYSIIIPCYNQAHYLSDAVESVLSQDFKDLEIIIINDGSKDNTAQIANNYSDNWENIKVIHQKNLGLSESRNAGMEVALGSFFHFLDADDWVLPFFYSRAKQALLPNVNVLVTGYHHVKNSQSIQNVNFKKESFELLDILSGNIAPPVAFIIKKSIIKNVGVFDKNLKSAEDWDLWIRIVKAGYSIHVIPDSLVAYRYVDNSMSRDAFRMYEALKTVYFRGHKHDVRINIHSDFNKYYPINEGFPIKIILLRCLGVSILQGKISDSLILFKQEKFELKLKIKISDFSEMCSYLTFKYFSSKEDLENVLDSARPNFKLFFRELYKDEMNVKKSMYFVFRVTKKNLNRKLYGFFLGGLINKLTDIYSIKLYNKFWRI
ncbi:hypothetical protein P872_11795 [Rhodonellum psychrophilum GCM71 = DSM 17998]|uniref:Glycosyltransferase 2-like domain-containing protein n=2 Tax=Rhodonellum TaxID=336827 RepID=U5BSW5_9BACT|nr:MULTISPECIES: glycosyltransferase [Rhodonellum]ERM80983.1 hypothetical protein P872_11795 [Rhodonellum psychrophilum GCM71 = DSM 17998]SDZ55292.1 Glycosyl transferase family 2 [Rhodonellum ikkaensis]